MTDTENIKLRIRDATETDVNFIFNSWLKSYRDSEFAKHIANEIYFAEHHKLVERLLKTNNVSVACDQSDPDHIYGFICAGHTDGIFTVHYLYVKHTFRRFGIATALLDNLGHNKSSIGIYTHHTLAAPLFAKAYNLVYHPYVLGASIAD